MVKSKMQTIYQRQEVVKCYLFLIFTLFNELIHLGPNQSFRDVSNVWNDDSAF